MQIRLNLPYFKTTAILPFFARFGGWNGVGLALVWQINHLVWVETGTYGGGMCILGVEYGEIFANTNCRIPGVQEINSH